MTRPVTYKLEDLNEKRIKGSFHEAELQKTEQEIFRIEKVFRKDKKNGMALVKWRGYSSKFNSWVPISSLERIQLDQRALEYNGIFDARCGFGEVSEVWE